MKSGGRGALVEERPRLLTENQSYVKGCSGPGRRWRLEVKWPVVAKAQA